eukprot:s1082_g1.t1
MADERCGYNEAARLPAFGAPEAAEAEASQRPEPAAVSGDDELLKAKALVIEADQAGAGLGLLPIGVPPFWASQIKVLVLSGGTAGVGIAVYAFMMNLSIGQWRADAKMLHELRQRIKHGKPAQQLPNVFDCIASVTSPADPFGLWQDLAFSVPRQGTAFAGQLLVDGFLRPRNSSCSAVEIPVVSLNGHMLAMAGRIDWLRLWAKVFLVLSFLLLLGITTHDLALLNVTKKTEIMDLRRLRWQFPVLRKAFALATGLSGMRRLLRQSGVGSRGAALLAKLCIVALQASRKTGTVSLRSLYPPKPCFAVPSAPLRLFVVQAVNGSLEDASSAVILLHGLGDTAHGWTWGASLLLNSLPNTRFVLPTAPVQPVTLNGGMAMPSWYDIAGLEASLCWK